MTTRPNPVRAVAAAPRVLPTANKGRHRALSPGTSLPETNAWRADNRRHDGGGTHASHGHMILPLKAPSKHSVSRRCNA